MKAKEELSEFELEILDEVCKERFAKACKKYGVKSFSVHNIDLSIPGQLMKVTAAIEAGESKVK